ncbi:MULTISPECIES: hypothetical protein [unclassified Limnobacter]|uniref:hypothetical protein n=3 Tax=Limnobacter TaxID=131079 RepID=UPI000C49424A|nr:MULTISPECIES: hypothetical protein [unclassified Limnobacter]MAG80740.1 hypothetical protein [Sutterellaceae bacterium]MDP3271465.1 hypothetical protein [Limnobacter sp.]
MGDDIQNMKSTAEDRAVERAEQQLADPSALNMQFLQSTLNTSEFDGLSANSGFPGSAAKSQLHQSNPSGGGFSGLSPAYSGAGLLGAVAAADLSGASSAMGMAAQVASAAPVTFGKTTVGESASLAGLGNKALSQPTDLSKVSDFTLLKPVANPDGSLVPVSAEFAQLMAMLEGGGGINPDDALNSLIGSLGQNPSPESLQTAIDAVLDQINLLNTTFEPVFDNLSGDVQNQFAAQNGLPSSDLGLSIFEDAGEVSTVLTDLLGTINVGANPQLDSLLNLDSTFDDIASLVGSLPDLDLSPVTDPVTDIVGGITDGIGGITDPVTDIVDDVVGGITDPVVDPIVDVITDVTDPVVDPIVDVITDVTDPVVDPIVDVITDVTDPVVDPIVDVITDVTDPIVDPIVDPILDPVTDITDPLLEPILDPITGGGGLLSGLSSSSGESDSGLLDSLSSGISSSAGSEGGALDGLLGSLDQNK